MKILVHSIFYRPEPLGVGPYTAGMCEWLAREGHSARVVCPPPYYPFWKAQAPYRQWLWRSEEIAGVAVSRCPIWLPGKASGLKRMLYAVSFLLSSFPIMLAEALRRPDVVIVIEPSLLNALPSLLVAKLTGAVAWLHVQDFEIDLAFELGQFRSRRLRSLVSAVESWLMRRFDVVSSISELMVRRLVDKGVPERRTALLPNWVDTGAIFPIEPRREANGKVVALYSGSAGAKQGLEVVIEAARLLESRRDIEIVIRGEGMDRLRERARGLGNVRFLPLQPVESLNELLNSADIHLLPQTPSAAGLVMPSKLLGMTASGRPVVATAEPGSEVARVVSQCGVVVRPEDAHAFADAVAELADDPARRARLGGIARRIAVAECERESILSEFGRELLLRTGETQPRARFATR